MDTPAETGRSGTAALSPVGRSAACPTGRHAAEEARRAGTGAGRDEAPAGCPRRGLVRALAGEPGDPSGAAPHAQPPGGAEPGEAEAQERDGAGLGD